MKTTINKLEIEQLILRWGHLRDNGSWDELSELFHNEGTIEVTWYKGNFKGFMSASDEMKKKGGQSKHLISTPIVDIKGDRAISETNIIIMVRAKTNGLEVDVTTYARFYDLLEKRNGVWRILKRITIYEKDRMDSVQPSLLFWFGSLFMNLKKFPEAYKYLAFVLDKNGYSIMPNIPVHDSDEVKIIYSEGKEWLNS